MNQIEIDFMGQKISLKTQGDPEIIKEVVELVSLKLEDVRVRSKSSVPHQVALLALLELSEEYVKAKKKFSDHKKKLEDKTSKMKMVLQKNMSL